MHTAVEMFKLETRTDVGRPLLIRDDHQNLDTFVNSTEFLSILYDSSKLNVGNRIKLNFKYFNNNNGAIFHINTYNTAK